MQFRMRLPGAGAPVVLKAPDDGTPFDARHYPPVFQPVPEAAANAAEDGDEIVIAPAAGNSRPPGRRIINYRDAVQIYEDGRRLRVALGAAPKRDLPIMANMGVSLALCHILCRENIFPLHAAVAVRKEKGFVFMGPSGAGKTTVCRLSAGRAHALCDELSAALVGGGEAQGENATFCRVCAGPRWAGFTFRPEYYDGAPWDSAPERVFPLAGVFLLAGPGLHAGVRLENTDPIDAAVALMTGFTDAAYVKALPAADQEKAFHSLSALARAVPCHTLGFDLHDDFWAAIDAAFPA